MRFVCVIRRRIVYDKMMSFDFMLYDQIRKVKRRFSRASEHVRACSEFRAERENIKDKTAQVTKDKIIHHEFLSFFLFGFSL